MNKFQIGQKFRDIGGEEFEITELPFSRGKDVAWADHYRAKSLFDGEYGLFMEKEIILSNPKEVLLNVFAEVEEITGPLQGAFIAGGAIASLVLGETPNDYDIWFEEPAGFEAVDWMIATKMDDRIVEIIRSKYATSLKLKSGIKVQLVKSRFGVPEVLTKQFDFQHTQGYMKRDGTLVCDEEFIKSKKLVFVPGNFSHPVNTMQRVNKFARRGYDIPFETTVELMKACTGLDPETIGKSDRHTGSL